MIAVIEEGRLCGSCAQVLVNGEDSCEGDCAHGTGLPARAILSELNEEEFYKPWRPCPGCGSTDAGTWGKYVVLGRLIGVINAAMFGTETEPGEHVNWSEPDVMSEEDWADLLDGETVVDMATNSPHMIVFEVES